MTRARRFQVRARRSCWLLLGLTVLPACALPQCGGAAPLPAGTRRYAVVGRLAFPDDRGCGSEVSGQNVSWSDCHAFKNHFDPATGKSIDSNVRAPGAFRPLPATVNLRLLYRAKSATDFQLCATKVVRSNLPSGSFRAQFEVEAEECGAPGGMVRVEAEVPLIYIFTNNRSGANRKQGSVRAVWRKDQADAFLAEVANPAAIQSDLAFKYKHGDEVLEASTPTFFIVHEMADPAAEPGFDLTLGTAMIDLGLQRFADAPGDDAFDYIKHLLSGYASVISAHRHLIPHVGAPDHVEKLFASRSFVDRDLSESYLVWFAAKGASANSHNMNLLGPDVTQLNADGLTGRMQRSLDNVGVIAHELGHSIHGTFASSSLVDDYGFANPLMEPNGTLYDWGHGWGQYQEMGVSFVEGLASSIGQYLVNKCGNWRDRSPVGGADPFWLAGWVPDPDCDAELGCSTHHIRYQLVDQFGLQEGGGAWRERVSMLAWLAFYGFLAEHRFVTSNSEGNWAQLGCDLLDDDDDVSHAEGIVNGSNRQYLADYTYQVGRALGGDDVLATGGMTRWYSPYLLHRETAQLTLRQLLDAMGGFCAPDRCGVAGDRAVVPGRTDADYPKKRLSALLPESIQSPSAFLGHLVQQGLLTAAQQSLLLTSNFMEDPVDAGE